MRILSWNVNGIRAAMSKGFKEWVKNEDPDILCVQETKADPSLIDESILNIEGYFSYWSAAEKKGYSGVAIYTKCKPLTVSTGFGIQRFDCEGRILIAEYDDFTLLNIYFPNGQMNDERLKYKLEFYDATLDYCEKLKSNGKKLVICGDYNTAHKEIDIKNPKANEKYSGFLPIERQWIDKFISHGYYDTFRLFYPDIVKYSWWSYRFNARQKNVGWRIDYFFVSENILSYVSDTCILNEVQGSDHCPVSLSLKCF